MTKQKQMNDEQLADMGRILARMQNDAIATWRIAILTFPVQSKYYRKICASGRSVQSAYMTLRDEAIFERGWSNEKVSEVFGSCIACSFR